LKLYDLATGDTLATYVLKGKAVFLRFNLQGNRLFVLNDAQTAYNFDLSRMVAKPAKPVLP
jgi:hypothetical protein